MDERRFLEVCLRYVFEHLQLVYVLCDSAPPLSDSFLVRAGRRWDDIRRWIHAPFEYHCSNGSAISHRSTPEKETNDPNLIFEGYFLSLD